MAEVEIRVGGRSFTVACQEGEEEFLRTAARLLNSEAEAIVGQLGKLPDAQMLLMAGLMLADRTASMEDRLKSAASGAPAAPAEPEVPDDLLETLSDLAERAEGIAERIEAKASP